jgi:hypothetical protein
MRSPNYTGGTKQQTGSVDWEQGNTGGLPKTFRSEHLSENHT